MAMLDSAPSKEILANFQQMTGMSLCVKVVSQSQATCNSPVGFSHHSSPFCMRIKRNREAKCRRCDLHDVPLRCREESNPFIHTCHAGASEVIVPVRANSQLKAIGYIGQFRLQEHPAALPAIQRSQLKTLLSMSVMLGTWLKEQLTLPSEKSWRHRTRKDEIITFLSENMAKGLRLTDLAEDMGISVTRAGHIVKEETGMSFVALRDQLRLDRARLLLQSTLFRVSEIASECGFSSPQHFHRFLRARLGISPLAYRKKHSTPA